MPVRSQALSTAWKRKGSSRNYRPDANNVTITAKGAALIDPSPELLHDRLARKLKGLGADDLARIQDAFERILDLLELDEPKDESPILTGNLDLRDPLED